MGTQTMLGGPLSRGFAMLGPIETEADEVMLMAEADTGTGGTSQSGMYLIQRECTDLVVPFLIAMGESKKVVAWQRFARRLPEGWATTYAGLFPGRQNGLLRVNAHPATVYSMSVRKAWERLGVSHNGTTDDLCRKLLACARGLDTQLDVDESGELRDLFGLEFFLGDSADESLSDGGPASRAMALLQEAGLADERWHQAAEACRSRRITLPGEHGSDSYVVSVRPFSVKFKVLDGNPLPAKLYLRGDAGLAGGR